LIPALAACGLLPAALTPGATWASSGGLRFDSEVIHLAVRNDSLHVTGDYLLIRATAAEGGAAQQVELFYPFPADPRLGGVRPGRVESRVPGGQWEPASTTLLPHGAGLHCRIAWPAAAGPAASDSLEVRATYSQALTGHYARYVVTTTRAWGEPLRAARFEIILPAGAAISEASYPFARETTLDQDGGRAWGYLYETTDFWPERDIVFEWTIR
jgi:hypothetical protein